MRTSKQRTFIRHSIQHPFPIPSGCAAAQSPFLTGKLPGYRSIVTGNLDFPVSRTFTCFTMDAWNEKRISSAHFFSDVAESLPVRQDREAARFTTLNEHDRSHSISKNTFIHKSGTS
jgi:hypothetical protein